MHITTYIHSILTSNKFHTFFNYLIIIIISLTISLVEAAVIPNGNELFDILAAL